MISTNQFRNGSHIDVDGTIFKIVEFQHVKPGKGGAFVRTKLRRASDGAVIDRTFRAGEKFRPVRTEVRRMQFLYRDGTDAHFMDSESYEQLTIPESVLAEPLRWMTESDEVELLYIDDEPSDVQLPSALDLKVARDRAGPTRRLRVRWGRHQAGRARDRDPDPGSPVHQHRRRRTGGHAHGRLHVPCVGPSSAARRCGRCTRAICSGGRLRTPSRAMCTPSRASSPSSSPSTSPSSTS